jgi:hypothetical protein
MRYFAKAPADLRSIADDVDPQGLIDCGFHEIERSQYKAAIDVLSDPDDKRVINFETGAFDLVAPPVPPPSPEPEPPRVTAENYNQTISNFIAETVAKKGYDGADSCASYLNSKNAKWAAEARAFMDWRDDIWEMADNIKPGVLADKLTVEDFEARLPPMLWPTN